MSCRSCGGTAVAAGGPRLVSSNTLTAGCSMRLMDTVAAFATTA